MACYPLHEAASSLSGDAHIRQNYRLMVDGRLAGTGCMRLPRRGYIWIESVSLLETDHAERSGLNSQESCIYLKVQFL